MSTFRIWMSYFGLCSFLQILFKHAHDINSFYELICDGIPHIPILIVNSSYYIYQNCDIYHSTRCPTRYLPKWTVFWQGWKLRLDWFLDLFDHFHCASLQITSCKHRLLRCSVILINSLWPTLYNSNHRHFEFLWAFAF